MRRTGAYFAAALLFVAAAAAPGAAEDIDPYYLAEIPDEYRGRWNVDAAGCKSFTGRYRLIVDRNALAVGGDRFRTSYIASDEGKSIGVVSDYVGPAKSWSRVDSFTLERGGKILVNNHAGKVIRRVRCAT